MIKAIHHIKLGDFDLMETTGSISQFKDWYNFLPAILFHKSIAIRVNELLKLINSGHSETLDLAMLEFEAKQALNINRLLAYESIIINSLNNRSRLMVLKGRIRSRRLRKITDKPEILKYAFNQIEILTGIRIEDENGIIKFQKHLRTLIDKYDDHKKRNKKEQSADIKKRKLINVAYSYLIYLGMSVSKLEDMKVLHFIEIRNLAIEKMNAEKAQIERMKNK